MCLTQWFQVSWYHCFLVLPSVINRIQALYCLFTVPVLNLVLKIASSKTLENVPCKIAAILFRMCSTMIFDVMVSMFSSFSPCDLQNSSSLLPLYCLCHKPGPHNSMYGPYCSSSSDAHDLTRLDHKNEITFILVTCLLHWLYHGHKGIPSTRKVVIIICDVKQNMEYGHESVWSFNSLRKSNANMCQLSYHHWFR